MLRWLTLLMLFCFINHKGSLISRSVSGVKGRDATLTCPLHHRENITDISLNSKTENIPVCETEDCNGRVHKEGSCDIVIKDLRLRDAGKYFLYVYYTDHQRELWREFLEYQLHIQDEISVNTGEELKMDVLLINAEKVDTNSSGQWTEVWTRGHGVSSDRLTDSDGNLTINEFTSTDAGTYRVLDSEGQILISITVSGWKGNLKDSETDRTDDAEHQRQWIVGLTVALALVLVLVLVLVLTAVLYKRYARRRKRRLSSEDPETLVVCVDACRWPLDHDLTPQDHKHWSQTSKLLKSHDFGELNR